VEGRGESREWKAGSRRKCERRGRKGAKEAVGRKRE